MSDEEVEEVDIEEFYESLSSEGKSYFESFFSPLEDEEDDEREIIPSGQDSRDSRIQPVENSIDDRRMSGEDADLSQATIELMKDMGRNYGEPEGYDFDGFRGTPGRVIYMDDGTLKFDICEIKRSMFNRGAVKDHYFGDFEFGEGEENRRQWVFDALDYLSELPTDKFEAETDSGKVSYSTELSPEIIDEFQSYASEKRSE